MKHTADDYGDMKWQIYHLAQGLTRARRMEKHRAEWFEELYENIIYPGSNLDYNNPSAYSSRTETQAIRIVELKERYDKKIQQEYEKHFRWKDLLAWAGDSDRIIMIRYFQKKKYIEPDIIIRVLDRLHERLHLEEESLGRERDQEAREKMKLHRKDFFDKYQVKPLLDDSEKQTVLVNGRFVQMSQEEYEKHKKEREIKAEEFRAELLRRCEGV